jgi:hypothetical protein
MGLSETETAEIVRDELVMMVKRYRALHGRSAAAAEPEAEPAAEPEVYDGPMDNIVTAMQNVTPTASEA